MALLSRITTALLSVPPQQLLLGIIAASTLILILEERRLALLPLVVHYVLLSLLLGAHLYRPLLWVRLGTGLSICFILHITVSQVQRGLYRLLSLVDQQQAEGRSPLHLLFRTFSLTGFGFPFRLLVIALAGLVAYGVWRNYPLRSIPAEINLISYWLMLSGLATTLISFDPVRMGYGFLIFVSGFEALYLLMEKSFLVIGLVGVIDIVLALAIVVCAEAWLQSLTRLGGEGEAAT